MPLEHRGKMRFMVRQLNSNESVSTAAECAERAMASRKSMITRKDAPFIKDDLIEILARLEKWETTDTRRLTALLQTSQSLRESIRKAVCSRK
jgi:hypothetical protein